jgi:hypothetical protein
VPLRRALLTVLKIGLLGLVTAAALVAAVGQIDEDASTKPFKLLTGGDFLRVQNNDPVDNGPTSILPSEDQQRPGLITRSLRRGLQDQKQLYSAPFKKSNLKWDALFLAGTAALIATDRQISRAMSTNHLDLSRNISNVCLGSTGAALVGLWAWGIKTNNRHAKETGELELETLANTFLIYTPMQFAAGRERPEEGTGNGRFWIHGGFNTSFPAGHPCLRGQWRRWWPTNIPAHG